MEQSQEVGGEVTTNNNNTEVSGDELELLRKLEEANRYRMRIYQPGMLTVPAKFVSAEYD